ncbi:MAG: succinylarginine dihydrolase, partial [Planctomycetia bacterium]|nr:succinylarginine dihydrolase [Planctomycetia bacterium]
HAPLPAALPFADEAAANQMRLCRSHGERGLEVFVYGREGDTRPGGRHPARQSLAASEAVARLHGLAADRTLFLRQSDAALDAGVFHNDVIAVANENVLIVHERAFADGAAAIDQIRAASARGCGTDLVVIEVPERAVPLADAVETYLFNSQLITLPAGGMALVCPAECRAHAATSRWLDALVAAGGPIVALHPVEIRQSMHNGGGPACLRLRVVLTADQLAAVHPGVMATPERLDALEAWVRRHYRDRLTIADLADPALLEESRRGLDDLTGILDLPALYAFQW